MHAQTLTNITKCSGSNPPSFVPGAARGTRCRALPPRLALLSLVLLRPLLCQRVQLDLQLLHTALPAVATHSRQSRVLALLAVGGSSFGHQRHCRAKRESGLNGFVRQAVS